MSILISLALALPQLPEPTAQDLHPKGADLVVAIPDLQAALDAFGGTALARTMADEELQAAIGDVMGSGPVDPVELLVAQLRGMEGELPRILDLHKGVRSVSMSLDLGGSGGESVLGLVGLLDGDTPVPDFDLRVVVDFEDEASCEAWTAVMRDVFVGGRSRQVATRAMSLDGDGGAFGSPRLTVMEISGSVDAPTEYMAFGGTRALMAVGIEDLGKELARLSRAAPRAFSAEIEVGRERLGAAEGTTVMELYTPAYAGLSSLLELTDPAGPTWALLAGPAITMTELMLGAPGTAMLRGGHWNFGIGADGRYLTTGWIPGPPPISSLKMVGGTPLQPSSLTLAHPDALVTSVASFDPEQLFDLLVQASGDVSSEEMEEVMQGMETAYGFRIDRDLIEPLGGSISYSLPKLRSLLSAPNLMAVASLDDREAFVRGMDGLMEMMEAAGEADGQRTEYRGATVYTWSLSGLAGGQGGMQLGLPIDPSSFSRPTVTVMDDRVLISTLPSHAKREVRRVAKLAKAGQEAEVHAGLSATELSGGATMVSFADWAVFYGNLYTQLRALAPMIGDLAGGGADLPLPFKLDSLPDMDVLTRHFTASERRWVKVDDGFMDITVSSLGPEIPAILVGVGSLPMIFMPAAMDVEAWDDLDTEFLEVEGSIEEPPSPVGAESDTQSQLMSVEVAVKMYQLDHDGDLPPNLGALARSDEGKPAYLAGGIRDGWGRKLLYKLTDDGYVAWSMGANAVDEGGRGDDPHRIYKSPGK